MSTYAIFVFSAILVAHDQIAAALSSGWMAALIQGLYWVFPKTAELGQAVIAYVSEGRGPEELAEALSLAPFVTTGAFGVACLILASWLFHRKEF
jgi:hypothetical protein